MIKKKDGRTIEAVSSSAKVKPELPSGFRDYGPEESIAKQRLLEIIKKTFEDFGFDPMETPSIERTEVLTGGEKESQKIIFNVKGSKEKKSDSSLRFDLTVPLARFLAANPEIPKPFRRYQIGNSWRGESPQAGRFREFMQADADIVGSAAAEADSEIIWLIAQTLTNLGIVRFLIKINNRKILNGLPRFANFPDRQLPEILRTLDKLDKAGKEAVEKEIGGQLSAESVGKIKEFLNISGDSRAKLGSAKDLFKGIKIAEEGISELNEISKNLKAAGVKDQNWEIDFSVVRGLGYYTGPVFEAIHLDKPEFGSVFSGGRYDNLMVPFTGQKIPAVGASMGVDRLFAILKNLGEIKMKSTLTKVLILFLSPELKEDYFSFAKILRDANINSAIYVGDDRAFQAQLSYAVKKEIPFVLIYGDKEKNEGAILLKNLKTREQKKIQKQDLANFFR